MKKKTLHGITYYIVRNRQKRIWRRVVFFLACIVVFCTTYALILPAITLEKNKCGMDEHIHTEECYAQAARVYRRDPLCSAERLEIHQHTEECYNAKGERQCGMENFVIHQHDASCYDEDGMLWCPLPEIEAHIHSEECYREGAEEEPATEGPVALSGGQGAEAAGEPGESDALTGIEEGKTAAGSGIEGATASEEETAAGSVIEGAVSPERQAAAESGAEEAAAPEDKQEEETVGANPGTEEGETAGITTAGAEEAAQKKLVCLLPEGFVHLHEEDCYDKDGNLLCEREESDGHLHGPECYVDGRVPTCGKEEVIPHEHGEDCYDEDGSLVCGLPQVLEHQHNDACFRNVEKEPETQTLICELEEHTHGDSCLEEPAADIEPEETGASFEANELTVSDGDSAVAARSADGEVAEWGYNEDGSIWWNAEPALKQVTAIEENKPYIIAGVNGNNLMADEPFEKDGESYLKAIPKEDVSDYSAYQRWYFEMESEGVYYIYYLQEGANGSERFYLQFAGAGRESKVRQLIGTNEKTKATAFTVWKWANSSYQKHFVVSAEIEGATYYINSYWGDLPKYGGTTHWLGYEDTEQSTGSLLKICVFNESAVETAHRLETATSGNTVINFFDYWTTPNGQFAYDGNDYLENGINQGHNFKFYKNSNNNPNLGSMNQLQPQAVINSGIVANKLENGYPKFSGVQAVTAGASESLDYLFDPDFTHIGKQAYRKVGGLLRVNEDGYYFFDSRETMAEYKSDENAIVVYDQPGVHRSGSGLTSDFGQFFPMNKAPRIMMANSTDSVMNHYLGLTITTRFIQNHGGCSDVEGKKPTTFSFAGDDDVWIFIDGVLVADLGGAHASVSVDIDFHTGNITINGGEPTTLKAAYAAALGADNLEAAEWSGNTYADNTTHTLKFFYLERGNYDSNLYLRYNLTEIPETAIYKVDQYGDPVKDARFAVYAADENYNMLSGIGGSVVNVTDPIYDLETGDIEDSAGKTIVKALYCDITDGQGKLLFKDADHMPYSLRELRDLFGSNFILREIKEPEGYRMVSEDTHLRIWSGVQTILKCENTVNSGSRAASTLQVTATDTLYLIHPNAETGETEIQYYNEQTGEISGTLFAAVLKYTGPIGADGNISEDNLNEKLYWAPVYGNDKEGYQVVEMPEADTIPEDMQDKTFLEHVLEAASHIMSDPEKNGDITFKPSRSSTMQMDLEHLPGDISTYYRMLPEGQQGKARYTVGYYWTNQKDLNLATPENTYRVHAFPTTIDGKLYNGFDRMFGAKIHIPNLINKINVQKMDEKDTLINGANFALYRVQQDSDGTIKYLRRDGTYEALPTNAVVEENGNITENGVVIIEPFQTAYTRNLPDGIHKGTAEFKNLPEGQYIIKEVKAPPGYKLNTADVMALVTEDTIYANAGTLRDGISVGRGPGYVVSTLDQFASKGEIDNTLTWIYAKMQISGVSTSFSDVGDTTKIKGYLQQNNSNETCVSKEEAATTYLKYSSDKTVAKAAFNYEVNEEQKMAQGATGTRRLFTTVGWPYYEIYQDYGFGSNIIKTKPSTNYEDWRGRNLAHLFSRSIYVRVRDLPDPIVKIEKEDQYGNPVPGAKFALYAANENYKMLSGKGGSVANVADPIYDPVTGDIKDSNGNIKAKALCCGTTDEDGKLVFLDAENRPYSLEKLEELVGSNFILREIGVPDGYRMVSEDTHLRILSGGNQKILKCDNTVDSGSRVSDTLQVTATDKLYLHNGTETREIQYYNEQTGEISGTLFAVVFKYTGPVDADGNIPVTTENNNLTKGENWTPVYGNENEGYHLVDMTDPNGSKKESLVAALEAARATMNQPDKYGNNTFVYSSYSTMQLNLENLPGDITTYYRMLPEGQKGKTRYTVGYYWTDQDNLSKATADNTCRVYDSPAELEIEHQGTGQKETVNYNGFTRGLGAKIHIPDLLNKIYVQKVVETDTPINGANFALYRVKQETDGTILYLQKDGSCKALPTNAVVDKDTGNITADGIKIEPLAIAATKNLDEIHKGTAEFKNLPDGQYIIKEVKAPPGYKLNTADVMVLVTGDTVYANAGTPCDGVSVGCGPGYVVNTLDQFASESEICNPLKWIYARMQISGVSTSFSDVGDTRKIKGYLTQNNSSETSTNENEAATAYLKYSSDKKVDKAVFDYAVNTYPEGAPVATGAAGTCRLFTTSGWPYYGIYQDYGFGIENKEPSTNYEDWSGRNLAHLFSRSVYVRVSDIPDSTVKIEKVDQYGNPVPGAKFALYAANGDYTRLNGISDPNDPTANTGVPVTDSHRYNEDGDILDNAGNPIVKALCCGTTDKDGKLVFLDADKMPYSLTELEQLFGSNFILREIGVPDGYRMVSEDTHLQILSDANQKILKCDNTADSGSRVSAALQVTATDKLYLYNGTEIEEIRYYDENREEGKKVFGTLFAVVFKYTGTIGTDGNISGDNLNAEENWTPVYGNDNEGYHLVAMTDPNGSKKASLAAALEAAREIVKNQDKYGNNTFVDSSNSAMQLNLENLPGDITTYYRMLPEGQKGKTRYTVGYYWTDQEDLNNAAPGNTYRVHTFPATIDGKLYSGFTRGLGAKIHIPDLFNKIYVQKVDETDTPINGATFALYRVKQEADGTIQYLQTDGSCKALPTNAVVDKDTGNITADGIKIEPFAAAATDDLDAIHKGTAEFTDLPDGQYIIKEIKAPPGYKLNTADVMVLVTEDTIYANAGIPCDGISVGCGPGYVVDTLDPHASEDVIDNTLTWIYARMRISNISTSFSDAVNKSNIKGYLKKNNSNETCGNNDVPATTYLKYSPEKGVDKAVFNYAVNAERPDALGAAGTRRLFTTSGWPYYEIYQDYDFGSKNKEASAKYEDWSGTDPEQPKNLAHLFSRSVCVRVRDIPATTVKIRKVDDSSQTVPLSGAKFRLYRMVGEGENVHKEYYSQEQETGSGQTESQESESQKTDCPGTNCPGTDCPGTCCKKCPNASKVRWTTEDKALTVTTGDDGISVFTELTDGTYYLEETIPPVGYLPLSKPVTLIIKNAKVQLENASPINGTRLEKPDPDTSNTGTSDPDTYAYDPETNLYTYTVIIPNSTDYELPETGGTGIQWFTFSGLAMMAGALGYYVSRKRRREQQAA